MKLESSTLSALCMQFVIMVVHAELLLGLLLSIIVVALSLSCCLQSPGKLVRQLVQDGEHVTEGQSFAEIEVMKMIQTIASPAAGVISFQVSKGVQAFFWRGVQRQGTLEISTAIGRAGPRIEEAVGPTPLHIFVLIDFAANAV